jgi:hypothetical protein
MASVRDEVHSGGTNSRIRGTILGGRIENQSFVRRLGEVAGWVVLVTVLWGTDLFVKFSERGYSGIGKDDFQLISEQLTSGVAVLIMVPFVAHWVRVFPLARDSWPRAIIGHTIGSVIFALGHFLLMIMMRAPWYALNGRDYVWREPFASNLLLEYQKDIKIYIGFVVLIATYQYLRRHRSHDVSPPVGRLMVQTGSGDTVVRFEDIDYLEAARNYVSVYAEGREYVVRDTMTNVLQKLSGGQFARTHRSFIVNIDKIKEIRSVDSSQRVFLESGDNVPLSRGYRDEFSRAVAG